MRVETIFTGEAEEAREETNETAIVVDFGCCEIVTAPFFSTAHDFHEPELTRCPGHVPNLPPTLLAFQPVEARHLSAIVGVGAICGSLIFAWFSDFKGRRLTIIAGLLLAIGMIPLWALAPNLAVLVAGAFLINSMVQRSWGVIPAHLAELSPDSIRGFLPGFAYQYGVLLSSSIVMIQALIARHMSYPATMAITAIVVFTGGCIAAGIGKERHGRAFGAD
jgi:MFS family permease